MSFDLKSLLRKHILNVKPYSSARDEYEGELGIFLDANENTIGSTTSEGLYNRYPDPLQWEVKKALSTLKNIPAKQIFLGNGSDEPIDLLVRAFCEPYQDNIIQMSPTYGMYQVSADINAVQVVDVPLSDNYQLDASKVLRAVTPATKIIFVCSPNNPTGNNLDRAEILTIIKSFTGLVVVDEAYIDFSSQASFIGEIASCPNVVVLQTFSKAWGLANLRLGMAFASEEVIAVMNRIKPPYNINGVSQHLALEALTNVALKEAMVKTIVAERANLAKALTQFGFVLKVNPSDTNFILLKTTDAPGIYKQLVEQQIIVRNRNSVMLCEGCLRITVGTAEENKALLIALGACQ
ncbi:MAG: histidinol-phosphate transaminase [Bacteroidota bacterium]